MRKIYALFLASSFSLWATDPCHKNHLLPGETAQGLGDQHQRVETVPIRPNSQSEQFKFDRERRIKDILINREKISQALQQIEVDPEKTIREIIHQINAMEQLLKGPHVEFDLLGELVKKLKLNYQLRLELLKNTSSLCSMTMMDVIHRWQQMEAAQQNRWGGQIDHPEKEKNRADERQKSLDLLFNLAAYNMAFLDDDQNAGSGNIFPVSLLQELYPSSEENDLQTP